MAASDAFAIPPARSAVSPVGQRVLDRPLVAALVIALGVTFFLSYQVPFSGSVLFKLNLPDSDDIMRLLGVRDLLSGQNWYDTTQYRYLPPAGASMHWSRLLDLPLAAMIGWLVPVAGQELAEGIVALIEPPLVFFLYLTAVFLGVRRLAGL